MLMPDREFDSRLARLRGAGQAAMKPLAAPHPRFALFLSVSDGDRRAKIVGGTGDDFDAAWAMAAGRLAEVMAAQNITGRWLRLDWVEDVQPMRWKEFRALLAGIKRNYFRHGLALDRDLSVAFLEQELNANAMLYGGNAVFSAVVNEKNFSLYARTKFPELPAVNFADDGEVFVLSTAGAFSAETGESFALNPSGPDASRRRIDRLTEDDVLFLIRNSSDYLAGEVQEDGRFVYGYHPCFDRRIEAYNALRHASSTYAMIEAWEVTRDEQLKAAIDRSLGYVSRELVREAKLPDGSEAAFLVEANGEVKLGGNAVTILALAKYSAVTGSTDLLPLAEKLAAGIRFMQNPETGAFVHVLNFADLSVKDAFRTIYYDGEAAFGLMRLYEQTRDPALIETVEKAFEHFIAAEHWRHHDHWLSYCVNELTRYRPEERYFRFGIRNFADYLDFVIERITTFPTLLELMMAAERMLSRIAENAELKHLLGLVDIGKFYRALETRAHYLLNGHFWPELAMYYRNPSRIAGSFFIRHHAFRVRIDDVEHYLSGFVAYLRYLREGEASRCAVEAAAAEAQAKAPQDAETGWTADNVAAATSGEWIVPPPENWRAAGLSTYAPAMQPGNLVVVRHGEEKVGMLLSVVKRMDPPPAGAITTGHTAEDLPGLPLLKVQNTAEAVLAMGRYARAHMTGKVVAVTGSSGKTTTVAMAAHALSAWGPVCKSAFNANLPHGVAWNLASMPWDTPHAVLELAIGRMAVSARMAQPDVAIFTNIAPAHLGEKSTLADIARTKSAIFLGMKEGATAVLNRDMAEWETVFAAAKARKLRVIAYGASEECDVRLLAFDPATREVRARLFDRELTYRIGSSARHMAINSLAILSAIAALGYDLEPALPLIESFSELPGRGEVFELSLDGRAIRVIDDAYNANPGSMAAALERLSGEPGQRRVAVLGEMAELGPAAETYHTELASLIATSAIDRVHVCGDLYRAFWENLPASRRGTFAASLDDLRETLLRDLASGDVVLFKGSHSTKMHVLVGWLKERGAAAG